MAKVPPTRWLDAEQQATWRALVGVVVHLPAQLDRRLRRDAGITHFEYQVLSTLSEAPERTLRMSSLAELTEASLPRLSQVVTRLETRGWALRHTDPEDGRFTLVTLTDPGWRKVVATAPGHVEAVRTLVFDSLSTAQQRQLHAVMRRIGTALDADPA